MTETEICELIRSEAKALGWGPGQLSNRAAIAKPTAHGFLYSKHATRLHTAVALLKALGYEIKLEKVSEPNVKATYHRNVHPEHHHRVCRPIKPVNDSACMKCGRDAGVVEVHGHLQCVHCGHVVQDCCGD